ncbi:MAG: SPASM domain-containing protein [Nitrospirae bacterium]|nr:SPASM domain-containing protein [Nitrospirota bacterium]
MDILLMYWLDLLKFFKKPKIKPFSAWQIELTTRCPINCKMCIRETADGWLFGDMMIEDFKKLTPYFKDVETVILEGWGDSLLHKDFVEIIRLVKAEGAQAGFVTSGSILSKDYISELINAGTDLIGFSLAGATSGTHNSIRVGSDLNGLLGHIQTFNQIKADKRLQKPSLHVIYLVLKDNISEIPRLPQLAKEIGIEDVVLTNLIHITNEWQEEQMVYNCDRGQVNSLNPRTLEPLNPYEDLIKEAEANAKELKITLRTHPLSPIDIAVCEEDPLRNLYISVDGKVSPCVYLYPPLPSPFKRIYCGKEYTMNSLSFGDIFKESFDAIWNNLEYTKFRDCFTQREMMAREVYSLFADTAELKKFEKAQLSEPPEPCRTCHKMLGV